MPGYFGHRFNVGRQPDGSDDNDDDDNDGEDLYELHVDDIEKSHELPELRYAPKGGFLSVRMPVGAIEHIEWC